MVASERDEPRIDSGATTKPPDRAARPPPSGGDGDDVTAGRNQSAAAGALEVDDEGGHARGPVPPVAAEAAYLCRARRFAAVRQVPPGQPVAQLFAAVLGHAVIVARWPKGAR